MTKQEKTKIIVLGIIWAVYITFVEIISIMGSASPNTPKYIPFIIFCVFILIPLVVVIISRIIRAMKNKAKIFLNISDTGRFILPFILGFTPTIIYIIFALLLTLFGQ